MNQQKTSAQLKALAKEQLLGNYGKIAGAFAVILAIYFAVFSIAYTAGMAGLLGTALVGGGQVTPTLIGSFIILFLIALIIVAIPAIKIYSPNAFKFNWNYLTYGYYNIYFSICKSFLT